MQNMYLTGSCGALTSKGCKGHWFWEVNQPRPSTIINASQTEPSNQAQANQSPNTLGKNGKTFFGTSRAAQTSPRELRLHIDPHNLDQRNIFGTRCFPSECCQSKIEDMIGTFPDEDKTQKNALNKLNGLRWNLALTKWHWGLVYATLNLWTEGASRHHQTLPWTGLEQSPRVSPGKTNIRRKRQPNTSNIHAQAHRRVDYPIIIQLFNHLRDCQSPIYKIYLCYSLCCRGPYEPMVEVSDGLWAQNPFIELHES